MSRFVAVLGSATGSASGGANNPDAGAPSMVSQGSAESVPLSRVALHELAHGLGLTTTLDFTQTNPDFAGLPDAFSRHVYSLSFEAPLSELDASARLAALTTPRDLVFTGPHTRRAAARLLARGLPRLELLHQAGSLNALENVAEILPPGDFARVEGGLVSVTDLCAGNPSASSFGAILLVEASLCSPVDKVYLAAESDAKGLILEATDSPPTSVVLGPEATAPLPALLVDSETFQQLSARALDSANAALSFDVQRLVGADPAGRPYLYTPVELDPGSTLTHLDPLVRLEGHLSPP